MSFPKIDGYVVTEKLGSGSYSTVYKAHTKVGARSIVAIKCVDKSRVKHSGAAIDNLITEIRLLKTLVHPHIVQMKHFTWDDRNIYIITEYCSGGDLSKYIHKYGRVPEQRVLYFLQQLASALKFLREKGVVHMDLKPHNLLLHKENGKYILKVADFGFAQHMAEETKQCVRGSPLYMAPEMLKGQYDARVDLWSVGVIMYECLFGKAPYSSNTFKELVDKIQKQTPIEVPRNSSITPGCRDLLTRLLQHDPNRRISYEDFFGHEYLDLDHMPSKENYEKAVSLIKLAIELDSMDRLAEALDAYRSSLLYLVPAVRCEADPIRKGALTAKLTRYMERAEEIKEYLKHPDESTIPSLSRLKPVTCAAAVPRGPCCVVAQQASLEISQPSPEVNGVEEMAREPHTSSKPPSESANRKEGEPQEPPSKKEGSPSKFTFRKLFQRSNSNVVPYLNAKDSSIVDEGSRKEKNEDNSNDMCRIT